MYFKIVGKILSHFSCFYTYASVMFMSLFDAERSNSALYHILERAVAYLGFHKGGGGLQPIPSPPSLPLPPSLLLSLALYPSPIPSLPLPSLRVVAHSETGVRGFLPRKFF